MVQTSEQDLESSAGSGGGTGIYGQGSNGAGGYGTGSTAAGKGGSGGQDAQNTDMISTQPGGWDLVVEEHKHMQFSLHRKIPII